MNMRYTQRFDVTIKAFFVNGDKLLVVRDTRSGRWEFPGGRIDVGEEHLLPQEILVRELAEELGSEIHYRIDGLVSAWPVVMAGEREGDYAYVLAFKCSYHSGNIHLSPEHSELDWVDSTNWRVKGFVPGYEQAIADFFEQMKSEQ